METILRAVSVEWKCWKPDWKRSKTEWEERRLVYLWTVHEMIFEMKGRTEMEEELEHLVGSSAVCVKIKKNREYM